MLTVDLRSLQFRFHPKSIITAEEPILKPRVCRSLFFLTVKHQFVGFHGIAEAVILKPQVCHSLLLFLHLNFGPRDFIGLPNFVSLN